MFLVATFEDEVDAGGGALSIRGRAWRFPGQSAPLCQWPYLWEGEEQTSRWHITLVVE